MTKLDYNKTNKSDRAFLNDAYWTNPRTGFDQKWHNQRTNLRQKLGTHQDHNWEILNQPTGPHAGKVVCHTCGGKFVMWIPKGYIQSNT